MTEGTAEPAEVAKGVDTGNSCAGIFLIVLALCLLLVGGGCTAVMIALFLEEPSQGGWGEAWPLIFLSLGVFAAGCVAMYFGVRLVRGKYDR
jgi:hypothetical protein